MGKWDSTRTTYGHCDLETESAQCENHLMSKLNFSQKSSNFYGWSRVVTKQKATLQFLNSLDLGERMLFQFLVFTFSYIKRPWLKLRLTKSESFQHLAGILYLVLIIRLKLTPTYHQEYQELGQQNSLYIVGVCAFFSFLTISQSRLSTYFSWLCVCKLRPCCKVEHIDFA